MRPSPALTVRLGQRVSYSGDETSVVTGDGQEVTAGRLLRGDDLNDLSPADVDLLVTRMGLTTVIDLRSPAEVRDRGPGPLRGATGVRHVHHSLLPELGMAAEVADATAARINRAYARYPDDASVMAYIGRSGWNTLRIGGAIGDDELLEAVDASYDAIVSKLPKKDRPGQS